MLPAHPPAKVVASLLCNCLVTCSHTLRLYPLPHSRFAQALYEGMLTSDFNCASLVQRWI